MNEYTVIMNWDNEAQVWYCTSEDIPGLILESESLDVLVGRARDAAAELLELMGNDPANAAILFKAERREKELQGYIAKMPERKLQILKPLLTEFAEPLYTIEQASPAEIIMVEERMKDYEKDPSCFVPYKKRGKNKKRGNMENYKKKPDEFAR
ncbi:MAG: DUF1902 domain-containing protein [Treponema sp.]|nr:DUF1902 domain-containing protein [Treponema sp.]MCL2139738.1 DUF1902 domain-containing protein [Treponema sp.]